MQPRILVNAKAYPQAMGAAALGLARALDAEAGEHGARVALAVPATCLAPLAQAGLANLDLYAQHVDPHEPGAATGWLTAEAVKDAGAVGTLLNHAERKVGADVAAATVRRLRATGLASVLCADSLAELAALAPLEPTFLAIEPPELIGGDVSVTTADPDIVRRAAHETRRLAPGTLPLCGAGVKGPEDVAAALRLGAHGVLLASGIVKAKDPGLVLGAMLGATR